MREFFTGIRRITRSFRGRIALWFGTLTLLTLLSAGFYVGRIATGELRTASGEALYVTARSAADLVAANLRERQLEIDLLRRSSLLVRGELSSPALRELLDLRKAVRSEYAWIGVTSAEGVVRQATDGLLVGETVRGEPWFVGAQTAPYVGDVHEAVLHAEQLRDAGSTGPLRFVDFAAPILASDGTLRGILGAHARWSWVVETVESVVATGLGEGKAQVLIADRLGTILYPEDLAAELRFPERRRPTARHEVMKWSDGEYFTSVVGVESGTAQELGWQIIVRQPVRVARAASAELRDELTLLGLIAAILFAAVAYRLAARVSRPVEQLARAVRSIERGDRAVAYPIEDHIPEVKLLNSAIQSMTASVLAQERKLQELNASLERLVEQRTAALKLANAELERLASSDPLTGVHNRRRFDEKLRELHLGVRRHQRDFSLLVVDADHFKKINDTWGHQVGDDVLRHLARLLGQSVRVTDFVARFGGEEFVVLLPDTPEDEGLVVAEKIRHAVATSAFPVVGSVTISIGLSSSSASDDSEQAVLERADRGLYIAKQGGRKRVAVVPPGDAAPAQS